MNRLFNILTQAFAGSVIALGYAVHAALGFIDLFQLACLTIAAIALSVGSAVYHGGFND